MASTAMVSPWKKSLLLTVLLYSCVSYADSVSLSDIQSISGFSKACTAVWEDDISGCTTKDFKKGHTCSSSCIAGLETISTLLNKACEGQRAGEDSLIGLFFQGEGVSTLCPGSSSSSSSSSSTSSTPSTSSTSSAQSTTVSQTVDTSSTETTTKTKTSQSKVTTTTEQQSSTQTSTSQLPQSTSAATTSSTTTSESTSASTTAPSTLSITLSTATAVTTAGVEPSKPKSSSSSSSSSSKTNSIPAAATKGFGGSGNAFDILAGEGSHVEMRSLQMAGVALAVAWVAGNAWQ